MIKTNGTDTFIFSHCNKPFLWIHVDWGHYEIKTRGHYRLRTLPPDLTTWITTWLYHLLYHLTLLPEWLPEFTTCFTTWPYYLNDYLNYYLTLPPGDITTLGLYHMTWPHDLPPDFTIWLYQMAFTTWLHHLTLPSDFTTWLSIWLTTGLTLPHEDITTLGLYHLTTLLH